MGASVTVLITGAAGFVGSAVARRLVAEGLEVRALLRRSSDPANLEGLEIERHYGDLLDPATIKSAVKGCDAVFHVAADYRLWVPDPDAMMCVNVEATRTLMLAALDAGVSRIVHTSSVATLGIVKGGVADEDTPSSVDDMIGPYKLSKFLAEEEVRALVEKRGLPAVIVNPSTPIGPRDPRPTPTGRLVLEAARGRMPAYVDTGLNVSHVDDTAEGHWLAFQKGKIGERYIIGGDNLTLREILVTVAEITGGSKPLLALPHGLILPFARLAERIAKRTGKEPFATVDGVKLSRKRMFFSSAKAERELGYRHRPAREALVDAIEWFKRDGRL